MKGKLLKLLAIGFATLLLAGNVLVSSAESTAISLNFSSKGNFVSMGDLDCDEALASPDLVIMKQILLGIKGVSSKYANANGDNAVNIIDLVRLKKDIGALKTPVKTENGVLKLDGTAYYKGELVSLLKVNTEYQLSYSYTSDSDIKTTIKGVSATDKCFSSGSGSGVKYHTFKTGTELSADTGLELVLSGKGTVDNLVIKEITGSWIDSDNAEQGANDIF